MAHGNQNTGNYKKNRDKHEKKPSNSAKKNSSWIDMGKKTNSNRNRERKNVFRIF
jgi:hypothetical protein